MEAGREKIKNFEALRAKEGKRVKEQEGYKVLGASQTTRKPM
jgi:hypothetical protein